MKLVSESLNELYNFEKKDNPLDSLGIGKKALIEKWLNEMGVKDYTINNDFTINVDGDVDLKNKHLIKFPDYIQFNVVHGCFTCSTNQLISLKGCSRIVDESFWCFQNKLTSLKYCPEIVNGNFCCYKNKKQFTKEEVRKYCDVKNVNIYV